jgi:hypothetical protein
MLINKPTLLKRDDLNMVIGDSSEFTSQDYEPYVEKLKMDI